MDEYISRLDLLSCEAGSKMQMVGTYPDIFASALRMKKASVSRPGKALVLASVQGNLQLPRKCVVQMAHVGALLDGMF